MGTEKGLLKNIFSATQRERESKTLTQSAFDRPPLCLLYPTVESVAGSSKKLQPCK